jgi:CelD/BcsL family acetyltransferase involved in cellulose biosynthesis
MPRAVHIRSLGELRAAATAWDDLWRRSDATLPTARAETLAAFVEHFTPRAGFLALVIEEHGRWLAALPWVEGRVARVLPAAKLPSNEWPGGGDLLWDLAAADPRSVGRLLVAEIRKLPWPLLWLEGVTPERTSWRTLLDCLAEAGVPADLGVRWLSGRLTIRHDWEAFRRSWSRGHRQRMAARLRRLAGLGPVEFQLHAHLPPDEVEACLRRGFQVEDRGWKGAAGTAVLHTPGMFDFFLRQSQWLAAWGQLELALLVCAGRPIAFCYGVSAKGVFHSCKIGYDPAYAELSPGLLLQHHLLEHFAADRRRLAVDYLGPLTEYHRHWRPEAYAVGRLAVAPGRLGRIALAGYRCWKARKNAQRSADKEEGAAADPVRKPDAPASDEVLASLTVGASTAGCAGGAVGADR